MAARQSLSQRAAPAAPPSDIADVVDKGYADTRSLRATGQGPIRMSADPVRFGQDGAYSAFAGMCRLRSGRLFFIWRQGTDHVNSRDGYLRGSYSDDDGRSWTTPFTVLPNPGGGVDLRDVGLAAARDGSRIWLTYFKGSSSNAAMGCFLRTSFDGGATWSAEVRVDPSAPYAALSGPIVETTDRVLLQPWYGRAGSETRDSVWVARSFDGGATWSSSRLVNGASAGRDYQEPWLADCGGTLVMLYRWGNAADIGIVRSTDGGSTWSTGVVAFTTGTGRPCGIWLSTGALLCVYRRNSDGAAVYRASRDLGATWLAPQVLQLITGSGWMAYSCGVELAPGLALCATSIEQANGSQALHWLACAADGAAESPVGDNFPAAVDRLLSDIDQVWAADDFDRTDTTTGLGNALTGQPWQAASATASQQMRIEAGTARAASADNSVEVSWLECGQSDVLVEADLMFATESGTSVVFRYVDASNYLMLALESNGAAIRLYKIVAGTATQLTAYTTLAAPAGAYHRIVVSAKKAAIAAFVNGVPVSTYTLSTTSNSGGSGFTEQTRFNGATKHGLRLNESSTSGPHRCRRFIVRAC